MINAQDFWQPLRDGTASTQTLTAMAENLPIRTDDLPIQKASYYSVNGPSEYWVFKDLTVRDWKKVEQRVLALREKAEASGKFHYLVGFVEEHLPNLPPAGTLEDLYGAYFYSAGRLELLEGYYGKLLPGGKAFIRLSTGSNEAVARSTVFFEGGGQQSLESYLIQTYPSIFGWADRSNKVLEIRYDPRIRSLKLGALLEASAPPRLGRGRKGLVSPELFLREK